MRRPFGCGKSIALALVLASVLLASQASAQYGGGSYMGSGSKNKVILSWKAMVGVATPFTGATNAIRGTPGDDLPWIVSKSAKGSLTNKGRLTISIKGLVFPAEPPVPAELQGINDEAEFRARVSCLSVDGDAVVESDVTTQGFAATPKGNAKIKAQVTLPQPCIAPIVLILGADEDVWFATTGY